MKKIATEKRARSKWLIFMIDQAIVCWSLTMSLFIVMEFNFSEAQRGFFFIYSCSYLVVSATVFITMKIHAGIVRYANLEDIYRIFWATLITSLIYWCVIDIVVTPYLKAEWTRFNLAVVVNFFISSSLLVLLRIYVKKVYNYINPFAAPKAEEVILIYNCNKSSIILKQALEDQTDVNYKILGYINDSPDKVGKHIQQKRIYHTSSLTQLKSKFKLEKVLVCNDNFDHHAKIKLLEVCVKEGIKVSVLPPPNQWACGKLALSEIKDLNINDLLQRDPIVLKKDNIAQEITGKRILVTGAAGSIGSEIVRQLVGYQPATIFLCDQAESPLHELQLELCDKHPNLNLNIGMASVQDENRMRQLFEQHRPEIVFHAAAYKHVPLMEKNPTEAIKSNVFGTMNLADLSERFKVEKFIMISTDKAVNPTNVMGATKRLAEIYIQSLQESQQRNSTKGTTRFITTRFGNVLGSNGSVVPRFKAQIATGGPITVTHPEITRYFMTIPEAVELVLEAGAMGRGGEIFVFDMGEAIKIVDLATNMIKLAGLVPLKDIDIVFTGLRPGEKLFEELLNDQETIMPTHHHKIKIAEVRSYALEPIRALMFQLSEAKFNGNEFEMISLLKKIMPEYKSNNSIFEKLDHLAVV